MIVGHVRNLLQNLARRGCTRRSRREVGYVAPLRDARRVDVSGTVGVLEIGVRVCSATDARVNLVEPGNLVADERGVAPARAPEDRDGCRRMHDRPSVPRERQQVPTAFLVIHVARRNESERRAGGEARRPACGRCASCCHRCEADTRDDRGHYPSKAHLLTPSFARTRIFEPRRWMMTNHPDAVNVQVLRSFTRLLAGPKRSKRTAGLPT